MGWAFCGADDLGREVGYGVIAECDHPECFETIDRGLGYCCGSEHFSGGDDGCGRYFCMKHHNHDNHNCMYVEVEESEPKEGVTGG